MLPEAGAPPQHELHVKGNKVSMPLRRPGGPLHSPFPGVALTAETSALLLVCGPTTSSLTLYVCANCQLPRNGGDSIHALFMPVAVLWDSLYTHCLQMEAWFTGHIHTRCLGSLHVSSLARNAHRQITHLPPPVVYYCRSIAV